MPLLIPIALSLVPELAKWLGGSNAGTVAGQVADVVRTITGTDDPGAAVAALEDPAKATELRVQLARIAVDREAAQRQADLESLRAVLADTAGARARDTALQTGGKRNVRADVMVALVLTGLVGIVCFLWLGGFEPGTASEGFLLGLGGLFSKCFADAFQFEFGSSRGSADKSATIASMASAQPAAPAAIATTAGVTVNNPPQPSPPSTTADTLNEQQLQRTGA